MLIAQNKKKGKKIKEQIHPPLRNLSDKKDPTWTKMNGFVSGSFSAENFMQKFVLFWTIKSSCTNMFYAEKTLWALKFSYNRDEKLIFEFK